MKDLKKKLNPRNCVSDSLLTASCLFRDILILLNYIASFVPDVIAKIHFCHI